MATWQSNQAGGVHPITNAVLGLSKAMFDPEIERIAAQRAGNLAVDQAQIGQYGANARKLDSDTALNSQILGARAGAADAFQAATNPDGTYNPQKGAAIYGNLMQGGGANGGDVGQLGDVIAQMMLNQAPGSPGYDDAARNALLRMGKAPDQNTAVTYGESNAISARDAGEAKDQAVTTQAMGDATSRSNNAATNAQSGVNNQNTIVNAFDMNTANNLQSGINNLNTNKTNIATNAATNAQSGANNILDNETSRANNAATNGAPDKMVISPVAAEDLTTRVSSAFDGYDFDQDAESETEVRAAELFQNGDAATGLRPGNPQGAVAQAFNELIKIQPDSWGAAGTPNAVLANPPAPAAPVAAQPAPAAPAAPPPATPAAPEPTATNPQTGQKLVFRNNQWIPL